MENSEVLVWFIGLKSVCFYNKARKKEKWACNLCNIFVLLVLKCCGLQKYDLTIHNKPKPCKHDMYNKNEFYLTLPIQFTNIGLKNIIIVLAVQNSYCEIYKCGLQKSE